MPFFYWYQMAFRLRRRRLRVDRLCGHQGRRTTRPGRHRRPGRPGRARPTSVIEGSCSDQRNGRRIHHLPDPVPRGRRHRFLGSRWKAGDTMDHLDEWGLGGRKFGGWITWFLVGGTSTRPTPSWPFRPWCSAPARWASTRCPTPSCSTRSSSCRCAAVVGLPGQGLCDAGRFRPRPVQLAGAGTLVAITGIVATMPYIALQLVGLESVLRTMGINGHGIRRTPPAVPRLPGARAVHLPIGPARAGADRVRQGPA